MCEARGPNLRYMDLLGSIPSPTSSPRGSCSFSAPQADMILGTNSPALSKVAGMPGQHLRRQRPVKSNPILLRDFDDDDEEDEMLFSNPHSTSAGMDQPVLRQLFEKSIPPFKRRRIPPRGPTLDRVDRAVLCIQRWCRRHFTRTSKNVGLAGNRIKEIEDQAYARGSAASMDAQEVSIHICDLSNQPRPRLMSIGVSIESLEGNPHLPDQSPPDHQQVPDCF
uniref:Uncharacterized protein n=1 Tax=Eutreptiella gymnastica TaxID=73025 RepID=A0A7S1IJC3_9EUGL|mmetsp:Transcript_22715/g.40864  ORF Transcript_22715/g.40864 Transcript_22715/m.40864 type:complete len:223 (+) Transcript_22715:91-759(+)